MKRHRAAYERHQNAISAAERRRGGAGERSVLVVGAESRQEVLQDPTPSLLPPPQVLSSLLFSIFLPPIFHLLSFSSRVHWLLAWLLLSSWNFLQIDLGLIPSDFPPIRIRDLGLYDHQISTLSNQWKKKKKKKDLDHYSLSLSPILWFLRFF